MADSAESNPTVDRVAQLALEASKLSAFAGAQPLDGKFTGPAALMAIDKRLEGIALILVSIHQTLDRMV